MQQLLLPGSLIAFLAALLAVANAVTEKRALYRDLGFIALCEAVYCAALFFSLWFYAQRGSFIMAGAAAIVGLVGIACSLSIILPRRKVTNGER